MVIGHEFWENPRPVFVSRSNIRHTSCVSDSIVIRALECPPWPLIKALNKEK